MILFKIILYDNVEFLKSNNRRFDTIYLGLCDESEFPIDLDEYDTWSDDDKRDAMRSMMRRIAYTNTSIVTHPSTNPKLLSWERRLKNSGLFNPNLIAPYIFGISIVQPYLIGPVLISPSLMSPNIVSPLFFSPYIISPSILNTVKWRF
jgi:hypothetical protein